ncbi:hypothetical protein ABT272_44310 [Streptomyces sp900105245]|uniref:Uncharacterized protein n=1 Tax=Streptomyces sp. 900105245 TaxID=3154379 RepID=A0ABV1ULD6_9ACTN
MLLEAAKLCQHRLSGRALFAIRDPIDQLVGEVWQRFFRRERDRGRSCRRTARGVTGTAIHNPFVSTLRSSCQE